MARSQGVTSGPPLFGWAPQASSSPGMLPPLLLRPGRGAPTRSPGLAPRLPNHPKAPSSTPGRVPSWGGPRDDGGHPLCEGCPEDRTRPAEGPSAQQSQARVKREQVRGEMRKKEIIPFFLSFFFFFLVCFSGPHLRHMEVPRLGVESELQLPAYTTATATRDPSHVCHLHHSSQQHGILNPLREARDQTWDTSQVRNSLSHNGNVQESVLKGHQVGVPVVAQ